MKADATQTLFGIQLLALALAFVGELAGVTPVVALGVAAFFLALVALAVTTTVELVDGVRRIDPDARVVGN